MRAKIFTCHHVEPRRVFATPLFQTLVSGLRPEDPRARSDLDGPNIAAQGGYSEMRHQYHVWKSGLGGFDHIGFEQYRRPLLLVAHPLPALDARAPAVAAMMRSAQANPRAWGIQVTAAGLDAYLDYRASLTATEEEALARWIGARDVLCTTPFVSSGIDRQYIACLGDRLWVPFVAAIAAHPLFAGSPPETSFGPLPAHNTYVMRSALLDEYLGLHFDIMPAVEAACAPVEGRWAGFLAERLFAIWLRAKMRRDPALKVTTWPFLVGADKAPDPLAPAASR